MTKLNLWYSYFAVEIGKAKTAVEQGWTKWRKDPQTATAVYPLVVVVVVQVVERE